MSAGQIWRRPDEQVWVEIQTPAVDPSGWRLMVPLVEPTDAPEAPPLVVPVAGRRARVHLLRAAAEDDLGEPAGELDRAGLAVIVQAAQALIAGPS